MRIQQVGRKLILDQQDYLKRIVTRFGLDDAKLAVTPLPECYEPEENKGTCTPEFRQQYQSIIGSLLYIMLGTHPDISYAVIKMAQFTSNPSSDHINKAKQIICYLGSTPDLSLVFDGSSDKGIIAFCDSDWASDKIKHKSQTGYFFQLAGASISWQSCAQKTIALSSTEAEYMALCDCCKQAKWIKTLLSELGIDVGPVPINGDNQGSIFLGSNPVQGNRSKHIDIRYHFV